MTEATEDIASRAKGRQRTVPLAKSNWMRMRYPLVGVLAVLILFGAWAAAVRTPEDELPGTGATRSFRTNTVEDNFFSYI